MTEAPASETVDTAVLHRVELSLAADAQMLFLARMTGAAVATRAELDYEQVEDLRLAVDELCIGLIRRGSGGRVHLVLEWDDEGTVDVAATLVRGAGPARDGNAPGTLDPGRDYELSERILDALVDEHAEEEIDGSHRAWFRMKRRRTSV